MGNLIATAFVLAIAGVAGLVTLTQLRESRWEQMARAAFSTRVGSPAPNFLAASTHWEGLGAEAAAGVLMVLIPVSMIRRWDSNKQPINVRVKWRRVTRRGEAAEMEPNPRGAASKAASHPGSVAADRVSAVIWVDHIARQQDTRKSA